MSIKILLRKTSLVDFPERVSSVFFFSGCNLRCPWCHNRELVCGGAEGLVTLDDALAYVKKRQSVLGGVVLSGGEPCLCNELPGLVGKIKKLMLPVKLDTNGMFPVMLEKLFSREETRPDYIALDLKTAPERYMKLLPESGVFRNGIFDPGGALIKSASLVRASGIAHEYRTVALPAGESVRTAEDVVGTNSIRRTLSNCITSKNDEGGGFVTEKDIEALAPLADNAPWYFRPFRAGNCLDPEWDDMEESSAEAAVRAEALTKRARELGKNGETR